MADTRRRGRPHVEASTRETVVARLLEERDRGEFRSELVELVAEQLNVAPRTVWQWLAIARADGRTTRKPRPRLDVTEADVVDLAYHRGNVTAFHRERRQHGDTPSVDAWRRAFTRALSPGRRVGIVRGERARRDFDTYMTRQPRFRNEEWQADHTQLAISVLMPDRRVVHPWATLFIDCFSRAITGFAITGTPSRESILLAMRAAITEEPPFGPMGGIPQAIRVDRGRDFLAEAIRVAAAALLIDVRPTAAYAPQQKGVVERVNATLERVLLSELPGFLHGAKDKAGKAVGRESPILPVDAFVEVFARFVGWYNEERPHEGLNGRTPLEVWHSDPTPVRTVATSRLRHLLLVGEPRTVTNKGVQLNGHRYNAAELTGHVGESVAVRYMPHHDDEVEIFLKDRHLCTARLVSRMSRSEVQQLLERRAEEAKWLRRVTRAAERKRRVVYAAMTEPAPAIAASRITDSAAVEVTAYSDQDQQRLASRTLVDHGTVPARLVRPRTGGAR